MKKILKIFFVLVLTIMLWWAFYPWATWRYKMTVVVETPEGLKTGSVVQEVSVGSEPALLGVSRGGSASVKGEALVVDLGYRGKLFVLNHYPNSYGSMLNAFYKAFPSPDGTGALTAKGIHHYAFLKNAKAALPLDYNFLMVTFSNPNDPKTIKLAKMNNVHNDNKIYSVNRLEENFGKGVRLKHIFIETTDEPTTWAIEESLPWIYSAWPHTIFTTPYNVKSPDTLDIETKDDQGDPVHLRIARTAFTTGPNL